MIGMIHIDSDIYTTAVSKAEADTKAIKQVKKPVIEKNTLPAFKGFIKTIERVNKSITGVQSICATDTKNMKAVATKMETQDQTMAYKIKENTVRFQ